MLGTSELMNKFDKLSSIKYRHAYVGSHIKIGIATQIRLLRNKANLTQSEFAKLIGTKQAVISRLEDPECGSVNLNTLLKIAKAFDVSLIAKFVPFSKFLEEAKNISPEVLTAKNFTDERDAIKVEYFRSKTTVNTGTKHSDLLYVFNVLSDPNNNINKLKSSWDATNNDFYLDSSRSMAFKQNKTSEITNNYIRR